MWKFMRIEFLLFVTIIYWANSAVVSGVSITKSAYQDVVIEIQDSVPMEKCTTILNDLENSVTAASQFLFSALDGRAYFGSVTVIIPSSWPETCTSNQTIVSSNGEHSDITITAKHPIHNELVWTQQAGGCGEPGEQIYASYNSLNRDSFGKELIREWAKYRYGVFDEKGYAKDAIYPKCYMTDRRQVTGCSDSPINVTGVCDNGHNSDVTSSVDPTARSSIMFSAESPNVVMFCDEGNHNRYAPTKHNQLCNRQSTLDVILKHPDFSASNILVTTPATIINTTPTFTYKKRHLTRYVLVIDETQDMQIRESWSFLRNAIRKWVVYDLPENTEVGVVLANDTASEKILPISPLTVTKTRDLVASFIPYSPSDSRQPACINCAVKDAIQMLADRAKFTGPASGVVLVIAPGMDYNTDHHSLAVRAKSAKARIVTVNYPGIIRRQPLDILASKTDGSSYTIHESKHNSEKTYLTTYFELTNVLFTIGSNYYEGNKADLPIEIHRKELVDVVDDGAFAKRTSRLVTGSFMLDSSMGSPASFVVYTHNVEHPLIQGLKLVSPNGVVYSTRSDLRLPVKQLTIPATINETGSWTYTIERFNGNPQPHYVQVLATPRITCKSAVIHARAWMTRNSKGGPIKIFAEVKKGELPVLSASVEVIMTRPNFQCNDTFRCQQKFKLLDTGSGDPDVTKGDGIYSRYFSVVGNSAGTYKFEIIVTDNGNTAYSLSDDAIQEEEIRGQPCCGSVIHTPSKQPLPPFQRVLPALSAFVTKEQIDVEEKDLIGKIGDLKAEVMDGMKVRLSWTSPDLGGLDVARYEVKYATSVQDIVDNFETAAIMWTHDQPFAFIIGDETSFTLNMTLEPLLIGQPLYFAIRAYAELKKDAQASQVSNYVRVFVPKPTLPSTATPIYSTDGGYSSWPFDISNNDGDNIVPGIAQRMDLGLELIIPIIVGILLLLILFAIYCYFCVVRRRSNTSGNDKKKSIKHSSMKSDKSTVNVIVPSPTHHQNFHNNVKPIQTSTSQIYEGIQDIPDPHTIGLPIYNMDDELLTKKRYSLVNQQEQQLIEELKQQQHHLQQQQHRQDMMTTPNNFTHCGLSIISSSNNTLTRNGRTLSPYESWTASQLLHEHERRHSPMDDLMMVNGGIPPNINGLEQMDHLQPNDQMLLISSQQHNRSDCISLSGGSHIAPPVPPLPYSSNPNDYQTQQNYNIYSGLQNQPPPTYSVINRNHHNINGQGSVVAPAFNVNPSLQGSMNSVNSGDKKRRNVTMV